MVLYRYRTGIVSLSYMRYRQYRTLIAIDDTDIIAPLSHLRYRQYRTVIALYDTGGIAQLSCVRYRQYRTVIVYFLFSIASCTMTHILLEGETRIDT